MNSTTKWWILLATAFATLMSALDTSVVNIGLPTLVNHLHTNFATVQWVVLSYLLVVTSLIVSVGRLGDLLGKKRVYIAGLFLFTLASTWCGLAPTIEILISMRALQALGAAVMMALSFALASDIFRAGAGKAIGILSGINSFGFALGPSIGGVLIGTFGWRAMFLVNLPIGVLACIIIWKYLPHSSQIGTRFDWLGTAILALALICFALAMTFSESLGLLHPAILLLLLATCGCLLLFFLIEQTVQSPLLTWRFFTRNPHLSINLLTCMLIFCNMMSLILVLPFFLASGEHLSPIAIGLLMSIGPLITALLSVPIGWIADRWGPQLMILGIGILCLGYLFMATLDPEVGILGFVERVAVINVGLALFQATNSTAIMQAAPAAQRGVVSSLLALARTLGQVEGASAMGAIFAGFAQFAAEGSSMDHMTSGIQGTFFTSAGIALVALVATGWLLWLKRTKKSETTTFNRNSLITMSQVR